MPDDSKYLNSLTSCYFSLSGEQLPYCPTATLQIFCINRFLTRASPLYACTQAEATPFQYFLQGTNHPSRLIKPSIKWIGSRGSAHHNRQLSFMQRTGTLFPLSNQSLHHSVKQDFKRSRHIAPITGCSYYQSITTINPMQRALCIVFR